MNVTRALIMNEQVSFTLANTTDMVKEAVKLHSLAPTSALVLGKALSAMTFMSACLKQETGEISLAVQADGLGGQICVSGNHKLFLRGFIQNTAIINATEQECLGEGALTIIRDDGYNRPFVGSCALVKDGGIDEAFEEYFKVSEQLPTRMKTVVETDENGRVVFAGVAVLQPLPFADIKTLEAVNEVPLTTVLAQLKKAKTEETVNGFFPDCTAMQTRTAQYKCNCSKDYLSRVLVTLGEEQLREIIKQDGKVSVHCHYCNQDYVFTDKDADALFQKD